MTRTDLEGPTVLLLDLLLDAEALFEEARRRRRRRRLAAAVCAAAVCAAVGTAAWSLLGSGRAAHTGASPDGRPGGTPAPAASLPRGDLQFRPVVGARPGSCHETDGGAGPAAARPVDLYGSTGARCLRLGPSVLSLRSVPAVDVGSTEAGFRTVSISLRSRDVRALHRAAASRSGSSLFAVVVLGRILSTPTGDQLARVARGGRFQIAGGFPPHDRLPREIARQLRSPLVESASPGCPVRSACS